jgi:uncharacterized membrane protein YcgQ (UPF0703/DUF1980 family)
MPKRKEKAIDRSADQPVRATIVPNRTIDESPLSDEDSTRDHAMRRADTAPGQMRAQDRRSLTPDADEIYGQMELPSEVRTQRSRANTKAQANGKKSRKSRNQS